MKLKILFVMLGLLRAQAMWAAPIFNENRASYGTVTIYKDHVDAHRYYVAPSVVTISRDSNGRPYFSYMEYSKRIFKTVGVMQMTLMPAYTREDLEQSKARILNEDPQAQFGGLPFIESSLALTGNLSPLISEHKCTHKAGIVGQEQACSIVLTSKGRSLFYDAIENKLLFMTLQFEYSVAGVIRNGEGSFVNQTVTHGIAVRIDGEQLAQYPELIQRR